MEKYIGIELGTSFSVAACISRNGKPVIVNTSEFSAGEAKRNMGSKTKTFQIGDQKYSAEEILISAIENVKETAEDFLNIPITGAVFTAPAYYAKEQKQVLKECAEKAGLKPLAVISEAEAVVRAYQAGIEPGEEKTILVYDMGAETFDVSILKVLNGNVRVLASMGNPQLGGHNFDQIIYNWYCKVAQKKGIHVEEDEEAKKSLMIEAEKAKKFLSKGEEEAKITVTVEGEPFSRVLALDYFEVMIEVIIYQTTSMMAKAMQEAGLNYADLDQIILAGGSARIPLISTLIEDETRIKPTMDVEPDEAVAIGAAYLAAEYAAKMPKKTIAEAAKTVENVITAETIAADEPVAPAKQEETPAKTETVKPKEKKKGGLVLEWTDEAEDGFDIPDVPDIPDIPDVPEEESATVEPIVEEEPVAVEPVAPEETSTVEPVVEEEPEVQEPVVEEEPAAEEPKKEPERKRESKNTSKQKYFIDFYDMFGLERTMSEEELKKELGYRSVDINKLEASTNPNDRQMRKELQEMKTILLEAIRILTNKKTRREYDIKLDAAIKEGKVERNRPQDEANALERARQYFNQGKYKQALDNAREAKAKYANSDETYEIIARSLFMLGDYMEAVEAADIGAIAFSSALSLHWLAIRFRIQLELYEEAQKRLNRAIDYFGENPQFMAEQAYLYFYAEKEEQGKQCIEEYLKKNPNDMEYRQYIAYHLIEIVNMYYKYDSDADMLLITDEETYNKCLDLVTLANQYHQDDYTKEEFDKVSQFGQKEYDKENKPMKICYIILTVLAALGGVSALMTGISEGAGVVIALPFLVLVILGVLVVKLVDKYSYRPYWQIYRDYYRGYKERNDSFIFTIVSFPFEFAKSFFD